MFICNCQLLFKIDLEYIHMYDMNFGSLDMEAFIDLIAKYPFPGYHYEQEFKFLGNRPLPLLNLLKVAYERALDRSPTDFK